ncbi:MAG: DUF4258 domain-containing protein [Rubrobacter sp.]|nr:DUF4258 domain-containing protein [Rubrobacter sp.]
MDCRGVRFSRHAIERMFERAIPPEAVRKLIETGEIIAAYPDDKPYPSMLLLGYHQERPVHAVVAREEDSGLCFVVTVYEPNPEFWSADFRRRRQR